MTRKTKSMRGEEVNFDLFDIKRQIGEKPVSNDVESREKFVFSKRRRGSKRTIDAMIKDQHENEKNVKDAMARNVEPDKVEVTQVAPLKPTTRRIIKKKTTGV